MMPERSQSGTRRSRLAPEETGSEADHQTASPDAPDLTVMPTHRHDADPSPVVVTDVRIKFWSMVTLLVQLAVAAVPAVLLLSTMVWILLLLLPRR